MQHALITIEVVLAILMTCSILIQHRASGLSAAFGATGTTFVQRRGAEKVLFLGTVWMSVAFFGIAGLLMYVGA